MERRNFVTSIGTVSTIFIAGCSSNGGSDNDTNSNTQNTGPFKISYEGESMFVSFSEDSPIQNIQLLSQEGTEIESDQVEGAVTRIKLVESVPSDLSEYMGNSLEVVGIDSNSEVIGRQKIKYSPDVSITEIEPKGAEGTETTMKSVGKGPVGIRADITNSPELFIESDSTIPLANWDYSGVKKRRSSQLGMLTGEEYGLASIGEDRSFSSKLLTSERGDIVIPSGESEKLTFTPATNIEGTFSTYEFIQLSENKENVDDFNEPQDIEGKFALKGNLELPLFEGFIMKKSINFIINGYDTSVERSPSQKDFVRIQYEPKELVIKEVTDTKIEKNNI